MPSEPDNSRTVDILPFRRNVLPADVLVTGASGFLGREIVRQFSDAGMTVRGLARSWPAENAPANVDRQTGDITEPGSIVSAVEGVRTVVHCAGLAHQFGKSTANADAFQRVNVQGTESVLRAAAKGGVEHVVLVSSVSVYGGGTQPTTESAPCRPTEPYGISKYQAECVATEIAQNAGIRLTILRMATIFGEGDPGNIARLMRSIDAGRFVWIGSGTNRKSLIYRSDAARACVLAATNQPTSRSNGNTYNISLLAVTVARIVESISIGLGRTTPRWYIPAPLVRTVGGGLTICMAGRGPLARLNRTLGKWLSDDIYPGEQFERDYQFHPEFTVEEGLWRAAAWYRHSKAA
ncbi:MAG: NAD-dependent epimerase/dehydratase family protein [Planctomycetota bacterium]